MVEERDGDGTEDPCRDREGRGGEAAHADLAYLFQVLDLVGVNVDRVGQEHQDLLLISDQGLG